MRNEKFCSHLSTYFKRDTRFRSKRTFRLSMAAGETETTQKVFKAGLSQVKKTLDFRLTGEEINAVIYIYFYLFPSAIPVFKFSIYLFSDFLSFRATFCFINLDYWLNRMTSPPINPD
jgi:hypothetical protein